MKRIYIYYIVVSEIAVILALPGPARPFKWLHRSFGAALGQFTCTEGVKKGRLHRMQIIIRMDRSSAGLHKFFMIFELGRETGLEWAFMVNSSVKMRCLDGNKIVMITRKMQKLEISNNSLELLAK